MVEVPTDTMVRTREDATMWRNVGKPLWQKVKKGTGIVALVGTGSAGAMFGRDLLLGTPATMEQASKSLPEIIIKLDRLEAHAIQSDKFDELLDAKVNSALAQIAALNVGSATQTTRLDGIEKRLDRMEDRR